jgi:transcriptional regulator with XRE-family HTH domain
MDKLKNLLYIKGYTQEEMAAKLGVNQETISRWVNNKHKPRAKYLRKMAEILEVEIKDLL